MARRRAHTETKDPGGVAASVIRDEGGGSAPRRGHQRADVIRVDAEVRNGVGRRLTCAMTYSVGVAGNLPHSVINTLWLHRYPVASTYGYTGRVAGAHITPVIRDRE